MTPEQRDLSYFPGCSLATTAKENNASLIRFLENFDTRITEVDDWNCCGSSSTHSVDGNLALALASRNLFLAPEKKPLLVACPGCYLRLGSAKLELQTNAEKRDKVQGHFNRKYTPDLKLLHFFELLVNMGNAGLFDSLTGRLNGLKIAPYYGCMLARPPKLNREKTHYGLIEKTMAGLGGAPVRWGGVSLLLRHFFVGEPAKNCLNPGKPDYAGCHSIRSRLHCHGLRHVPSES